MAEKGTVLVVDDDREIVDFVQIALEEEGYRVVCSVNGASLQVARDMRPDVILLDINMPGMDGVEVSRRLRSDPATAAIPIVAMSAQDRLRAASGAMLMDARLPKPFELAALYSTVAHWVAS